MVKLKDIMNRPETIQAEDTVMHAAEKMGREGVGSLPVMEGDILIGMLTDRDIAVRAFAKGVDPRSVKVEEIMTWGAETCPEEYEVEDAVLAMERKKVRRLGVLDKEGRLTGIVSLSDIAMKTHDARAVEEVLDTISRLPKEETP